MIIILEATGRRRRRGQAPRWRRGPPNRGAARLQALHYYELVSIDIYVYYYCLYYYCYCYCYYY